jgi:hypothetical protein
MIYVHPDQRRAYEWDRASREHWSLPRDKHHAAWALTRDELELLRIAAAKGGIDIGQPGTVVAHLLTLGYLYIEAGDDHRSRAAIMLSDRTSRAW